jgi:hypothetical protein
VEPLKYLQYELNSTRNQRLDNVTLILNRMWVVDKNADVEESELVSQSGQIIHTGDMKGIEPLPTPDVTASAYNEESMIKSDIQDASGISDYVTGQGASGKSGQAVEQTATGIALYQEAGNARIKFKLDNMEDALREFGLQLMALLQQFLTHEFVIRIVGAEGKYWKRVTPEEIQGNFDLTVEAGSTQPLNKSMRRAQAREIVNTLVPLLKTPQGQQINLQYYLKYLLESYELTNIDEAFNQQPIVPQIPPGQGGGQTESPLAGTGTSRGMAPEPGIFAPDAINGGSDMVANAPTG